MLEFSQIQLDISEVDSDYQLVTGMLGLAASAKISLQ